MDYSLRFGALNNLFLNVFLYLLSDFTLFSLLQCNGIFVLRSIPNAPMLLFHLGRQIE